jgi:hypothetical protein
MANAPNFQWVIFVLRIICVRHADPVLSWLAASLGYASGQAVPSLDSLEMEQGVKEEDIIQQELVKVTITKARIIRAIPDDGGPVDEAVIENFRRDLNEMTERLPEWMTMGALISGRESTPMRRFVMYFHLFFLSAMQLLYRRAITNATNQSSQSGQLALRTGIRDDLMAAKMVARMLSLMNQEGYIGQFCWMCMCVSAIRSRNSY